jgi:predicted enzyme related to lactoylglutathione lyase
LAYGDKLKNKIMERVTGLGGFFFKSQDPEKLREWYDQHLGIKNSQYGTIFEWKGENGEKGQTVWNLFKESTKYFDPSEKQFMINYRVKDLLGLIEVLKKEGVTVIGEPQVSEYGKFGWILDPEGNKIELWEPPID